MLEAIREDVTRILMLSVLQMPETAPLPELPDFLTSHIDNFSFDDAGSTRTPGAEAMMGAMGSGAALLAAPGEDDPYKDMGLSRNAACPCGSGEKYKHCHGAVG